MSLSSATLSFNSLEQKIYSYGKNFVSVKKNLDLQILRPQRRIIIKNKCDSRFIHLAPKNAVVIN